MIAASPEHVLAEQELDRRARLELSKRLLAAFCERMDPRYEPARHTALLVEHLEAVERGDIRRLAVFMPPRHSKTYHVSERFPAWFLGRNPERRVILASYGADLAEGSSRKVRNLMLDDRWPFRDVQVASDSAAVNKWATNRGGEVIAAGVGGAMTGFGADVLIIDDPVKGRAEADSETFRESTWNWYVEVARTRLMPGGRIVLCQTRWHEDDLAGRILAGAGVADWTVLNLPAVAGEADAMGRGPGEALWPEWFGDDALGELRRDLTNEQGSRAWSALYQQRPAADEGGMFRRAWFGRRWTDETLPAMTFTVLAVDSAFKTGVSNDPSAIHLWGTDGLDYYLLAEYRGRWEFPDLKREILSAALLHAPNLVLIEDTAAGQSAIQEFKRATKLPIVAHKVTASKEARAQAVSPLCEAGKVVLPTSAPWVGEWLDEHAAFPTGRHDDRVDNTSAALARLAQIGVGVAKEAAEPLSLGWQSGAKTVQDEMKRLSDLLGELPAGRVTSSGGGRR
jgi:predicted phage terminase large subunit-like protein